MLKKYDFTEPMSSDIIFIDEQSFNDIHYSVEEFSYRMKNASNYCIYVKYIKSIPVGYIGLLEVQNPHYHGVWIDLIAVSKQYNNQNIAQNMIKSIVEKFNNKGINLFTALVKETNKPSLKVFEKNQFKGESACFKLLCLEKK